MALVSGGKDSCYSMYLAQQHGHEVVALANLLPAEDKPDELDSYMYQTVRTAAKLHPEWHEPSGLMCPWMCAKPRHASRTITSDHRPPSTTHITTTA